MFFSNYKPSILGYPHLQKPPKVSDDDMIYRMIYPTKKNMPMIWQMFKSQQSTAEAIYKSGMKNFTFLGFNPRFHGG